MKIAPLFHALTREPWCRPRIVHTGQHYDQNMSEAFFRDLELPDPHLHLGVGSGSHAEQLGGVMIAYERALASGRPDWIVVVGDVNSTAACALVGAKQWIPVVHLEAGLRSRDRRMPEEINRMVTDAVADVLWTPSSDADENLRAEGIAADKIDRVGNIMIDSYELMRSRIEQAGTRQRLGLDGKRYGVVTMHRPSNVDERTALSELVDGLVQVGRALPLVFPVHPRTRRRLEEFGMLGRFEGSGVQICDPMPYVEFMNLVSRCALAITDSGGIQEETT
ncbi:MAG: non-hydrolyzing UDP-N-acetylglucosamine 2-epimerase, partial [Solimonas sp.]